MSAVTSPIGAEALDGPSAPPELVRAALGDIAWANALFGGRAAAWYGIERILPRTIAGPLTVLDVGAGCGDIAAFVARRGRERGVHLVPLAFDVHREAAVLCRGRGLPSGVADAWALPLAERSVDIVVVSQVLHHFSGEAAIRFLRGVAPLARIGVVIADLRRARAAALGIWLASLALGFHPVTRRDGVTSVRRGFTASGLGELLVAAGIRGQVYRRPGYRLVAAWRTSDAHH